MATGDVKKDQDLFGVFSQSSYVTLGDPYPGGGVKKMPGGPSFESAYKGTQMGIGKRHDEFFSKKFERMMEGEAYTDPVKLRRNYLKKEKEKMRGKGFIPASGTKTSTAGSYVGTIGGKVEALSNERKKKAAYEKEKKNFLNNPPKKGGYGTPGIGIGKDPEYKGEAYNLADEQRKKEVQVHMELMKKRGGKYTSASFPPKAFDDKSIFKPSDKPLKEIPPPPKPAAVLPFKPAKKAGDMQGSGKFFSTFDKFTYVGEKWAAKVPAPKEKVFKPLAGFKSTPQKSVLELNVKRSMNADNFRTIVV